MNASLRRIDLLKLEGDGFSKPEIVKQLVSEYNVTKQMVYYDFRQRSKWQPALIDFDGKQLILKIKNRYEQIYRKAAYILLIAKSNSEKLAALRTMLDATKALYDATPSKEYDKQLKDIKHRWDQSKIVVKMWQPPNKTEGETI